MPILQAISFLAMGSECSLHLYAASAQEGERVADLATKEAYRIERKYSRFLQDSELSRLNRLAATGENARVDEETGALLDLAQEYFRCSKGLFDITSGRLHRVWDLHSKVPPNPERLDCELKLVGFQNVHWRSPVISFVKPGIEFDFGGIAKEYAADRVAEVCVQSGITGGLVNLAGDIRVIGPHPDGSGWNIGISNPKAPGEAATSIEVISGGVATSGDYERFFEYQGKRYGHIINPKTGFPVQGLRSVTVWAERCVVAGLLSTIAILKEGNGAAFLNDHASKYLWIDESEKVGGRWPPFI